MQAPKGAIVRQDGLVERKGDVIERMKYWVVGVIIRLLFFERSF
jgi:hypothetical protein